MYIFNLTESLIAGNKLAFACLVLCFITYRLVWLLLWWSLISFSCLSSESVIFLVFCTCVQHIQFSSYLEDLVGIAYRLQKIAGNKHYCCQLHSRTVDPSLFVQQTHHRKVTMTGVLIMIVMTVLNDVTSADWMFRYGVMKVWQILDICSNKKIFFDIIWIK